ncbi:Uncharacterised protein [Bacillus cereus]|nr:Uncharacterised protein [Bacillus cereus]
MKNIQEFLKKPFIKYPLALISAIFIIKQAMIWALL